MNPPPITACLGLDQAARSGWGIGRLQGGRPTVLHHGVATDCVERRQVVELAIAVAGDPRQLLVMFEQHDHMALDRLTANDHRTKRTGEHFVQRGPKQIHGMGKAYGRWEERLDDVGHPERLRLEAEPREWRRHVLGNQWASKEDAIRWAAAYLRENITDPDEAEGCGICAFAMLDGVARLEARRQKARLYARGRREERRQLELVQTNGRWR